MKQLSRHGTGATVLVLASDRKPFRIFMIDGRNDNRGVNADGACDLKRDSVGTGS